MTLSFLQVAAPQRRRRVLCRQHQSHVSKPPSSVLPRSVSLLLVYMRSDNGQTNGVSLDIDWNCIFKVSEAATTHGKQVGSTRLLNGRCWLSTQV